MTKGSFNKPWQRRRRERHQTKGLISKTMAVHVRFEFRYISLPSSAKQQREMTKFYVFGGREPQWLIFCIFFWNWTLSVHVQPAQVFRPIGALNRSTEPRHSKIKYKFVFYKVSSPPSPSSLLELPNKEPQAGVKRRTSHEPNRMLMRENKGFFSLAFDLAHVKYGVWPGPKQRRRWRWGRSVVQIQFMFYKRNSRLSRSVCCASGSKNVLKVHMQRRHSIPNGKTKSYPSSLTFRRRRRTWSFYVVVLQTEKKYTRIYNACAQLLFCSLNFCLGTISYRSSWWFASTSY